MMKNLSRSLQEIFLSRGLDLVIDKFEKSKIDLEEKLFNLSDNLNLTNLKKYIIGSVKVENDGLKNKLRNKLESRIQQVEENKASPFTLSRGSRKVRGEEYIPRKNCQCCPKRIRPHRKGRRGKKKVVAEGPEN